VRHCTNQLRFTLRPALSMRYLLIHECFALSRCHANSSVSSNSCLLALDMLLQAPGLKDDEGNLVPTETNSGPPPLVPCASITLDHVLLLHSMRPAQQHYSAHACMPSAAPDRSHPSKCPCLNMRGCVCCHQNSPDDRLFSLWKTCCCRSMHRPICCTTASCTAAAAVNARSLH